MPHLDVPGASLYYETDGHISSPALLLLHAGVTTLRMWDPQIEALAARHFVIRFDARGYGQTQCTDAAFDERADALAVLDHLGILTAAVIGSSRGGGLALDLDLEHPDRVTGLVAIGSGPSGFVDPPHTERESELFALIDAARTAEDWHKAARLEVTLWDVGPLRHESDLDPEFVRRAASLHRVNAAHGGVNPTRIPLDPPAVDRLGDIAVPTLIVVGEFDLSSRLARYEYLTAAIPEASGYVFRDSAHLPSVEHPAEFERLLVDWLAENGL
ncbi:3-oxoadipate enol-lactonase [Leifsonia kafniensis]|uniref:3-oxoadipate enol-lactonase n=1 Tax=Leifsonia kafniensis TaxID=475957 RepID=A0ABP7KGD4_9MICO